jgi:MSHA biogenesis protein MshJ
MNFHTQIEQLELWIDARSHRERLMVLGLSFTLIYLLWYLLLDRPLNNRLNVKKNEIINIAPQIKIFDDQAKRILKESTSSETQRHLDSQQMASLKLASPEDLNNLMTAILSPNQNIKLTGLKNIAPDAITAPMEHDKKPSTLTVTSPPAPEVNTIQKPADKSSMQLEFQSNYFDTIAYLKQLENLPWCLSWDSLEYNVINYPNAAVTIKLHIVKAG